MTLFIARAKADIPFIQMIMDEQKAIGYTLSINTLLILSILYSERKLSGKELSDKLTFLFSESSRLLRH